MLKANKYFPRSCKCSIVTSGKYPLILSEMSKMIVRATMATIKLTDEYQANNVLYQCASTDITHNQIIAALEKPITGNVAAPHILIFLACVNMVSPWVSSSTDNARMRVARKIQTPIITMPPKVYQP